jgi:hypothetical protein
MGFEICVSRKTFHPRKKSGQAVHKTWKRLVIKLIKTLSPHDSAGLVFLFINNQAHTDGAFPDRGGLIKP